MSYKTSELSTPRSNAVPHKHPPVSVLIPVYNEGEFLEECLDSILTNDYDGLIELFVIDGGSTDDSLSIAQKFADTHSNVNVLRNPEKKIPAALNLGISRATGEIVLRMDAHSTYDTSYVKECTRLLTETEAANVGGIWHPVGRTQKGHAIAVVMGSRYALGNAKHYYTDVQEYVESVPMGAWCMTTLRAIGGFDENFESNEDYEINYRLRQAGYRILVSPQINFTYFVPASFKALFKKFFHRGVWKMKSLKKHPASLRWRQLAPPALTIALLVSLLALPLSVYPVLAILGTYSVATLGVSFALAARSQWHSLLPIMVAFATVHFGWGLGFWWGLIKSGIPDSRLTRQTTRTE